VDASTVATPSVADEAEWFLTPGHPNRPPLNDDPYPFFDRLREQDPVHRSRTGAWLLTRHADVLALLQSPDYTRDVKARRLASLEPGLRGPRCA
jgi:cytochrome P450